MKRKKRAIRKRCASCGGTTFVCAPCNGIVTGQVASDIRHELLHGTPDTPQRIATIKRATALHAKFVRSAIEENNSRLRAERADRNYRP